MKKALIVEDESLSRSLIAKLLIENEEIDEVREADSAQSALNICQQFQPDVVFMDIKLSDENGLELSQEILKQNKNMIIVFVTGYPEYAAQAFEIGSCDYLVKPITVDRFKKTMERVREQFNQNSKVTNFPGIITPTNKICIRNGHELQLINVNDVIFLEKSNKKTIIHTICGKYDTYETLNEIERRLDKYSFFRTHKSYLVNLTMIEKIIPWTDSSNLIKFSKTANDALITRAKLKELKAIL